MQVSESTCNWRPCSAARAISFPPRCCLAYQAFGASLVQGKHNQKIPMTHFTPGSMVKYHCYDAWNGSADFQGCTTRQMWWLSCTLSLQHLVFYEFQEIGSRWQRKWWSISDFLPYMLQRSGCQQWFINIQHPPSRRNVKPAGFAKVSDWHPMDIRSPSENQPDHEKCLHVSHVFSEKNMVSGIIWWVEQAQKNYSQLPRLRLPNCQ